VELFKKKDSKYWWFSFLVRGKRYRASTKETNRSRADKIAALRLSQAIEGSDPLDRKAPILREFSTRFLSWIDSTKLSEATKKYYRDGWRLLAETKIARIRLDRISAEDIDNLSFTGSAATTNCALRTLRRMFNKAQDWKLITKVPKLKLLKEQRRKRRLDDDAEQKLIAAAASLGWRKGSLQLFKDVVMLVRDSGMRNGKELYRIQIENIDWKNRAIYLPDSKSEEGRRLVPMTERAYEILQRRCRDKRGVLKHRGWVFPARRKTAKNPYLTSIHKHFEEAREKAGLPKDLVLYCGRHDYGTLVYQKTGNLAVVMKAMGHADVKSAMQYQHPELDIVRTVLNQENRSVTQVNG